MEVNEEIKYSISTHAKQRYAERLMDKDNTIDINRFITLNEEKIKTDINKLIQYGEMIYSGKQSQKDNKGNVIDVYLKDCWIILVDNKSKNVVTLYKVDLGLDEEFNKAYVSKMLGKLNSSKATLNEVQQQVQSETNTYKQMINDAEQQIKEYKGMIKNLEELSIAYKTVIDNNCVKVSQANREVADIVNTLISKKEF